MRASTYFSTPSELFVRRGAAFKAATPEEILSVARHHIVQRFHPGAPVLSDLSITREYLTLHFAQRPVQTLAMMLLNRRHRLIDTVEVFRGTLDRVRVHPRELLREALSRGAATAILLRTDPAGDAEPTHDDLLTAERAAQAFSLLEMTVLDYLIVGETITSLKERDLL